MKIDFNSSYKSLQRVIELPKSKPQVARARANFEALVDPKKLSQPEQVKQNQSITPPLQPVNQHSQSEHLQRLSQQLPSLKLPSLLRETVEISNLVDVKPNAGSVKKMTSTQPSQLSKEDYLHMIEQAGVRHGVDPMISMSVAAIESSFDPSAVSSDGHYSKGLFQLLDSTGHDQMGRLGLERDYDPFNPDLNTDLGVGYLRYLLDVFSSETQIKGKLSSVPAANSSELEKLAVAAFNAGEGRVASAQQRAARAGKNPANYHHIESYLPDSTQDYVQKVLRAKGQFETYFLAQQGSFTS